MKFLVREVKKDAEKMKVKKELGEMEFKSFPAMNKNIKIGNKNYKIISIDLKGREKILNVT